MTLSIENILSVATLLIALLASHLRLESRLTRLETQQHERHTAGEERVRRLEERLDRVEARRT